MSEVSLPAMQELQRLILRLNAGPDLAATLRAVVDGVVEGLGFGVAVVNLVHPDGTAEVVTVAGPPDVSATLLGTSSVVSTWQDEFDRAERWGALRYLAHTEPDNEAIASWVPDTPVSDEPDAWHPMDALFAPMYSVAGTLVGILSVDLPEGGRRPDEVQCALLEMYATQAGIAIDNARLVARVRASEESFRLAFENAPVGMSLVDFTPESSGRFLRVNEAMSRMLGRSRRELETLSIRDVTHPDDHAGDLDIVAKAVSGEIERYQPREALPARRRPPGLGVAADLGGARRHRPGAVRHQPVRGHQRPAGRAPGAHPAGPDRPAHRPAQPQRPGRAGAGSRHRGPAQPAGRRGAVLRPGRLQAGQRHARARVRRPGARDHRQAARVAGAGRRHDRALRGRRVRHRHRRPERRGDGRPGRPAAHCRGRARSTWAARRWPCRSPWVGPGSPAGRTRPRTA